MESNSRLGQILRQINDKLQEQVWFQQLKTKLDELDPQSKTYLKFASIGAGLFFVLFVVVSSMWGVRNLKKELAERTELYTMIQTANDELRRLRDSTPSGGARTNDTGPWPVYLETVATTAGLDKAALTISPEKPGSTTDQATETLFDVSLKKVNIRQAVKYAFQLENGGRPVKVRNLTIDTNNDPSGYLDAKISLSAFAVKEEKAR